MASDPSLRPLTRSIYYQMLRLSHAADDMRRPELAHAVLGMAGEIDGWARYLAATEVDADQLMLEVRELVNEGITPQLNGHATTAAAEPDLPF